MANWKYVVQGKWTYLLINYKLLQGKYQKTRWPKNLCALLSKFGFAAVILRRRHWLRKMSWRKKLINFVQKISNLLSTHICAYRKNFHVSQNGWNGSSMFYPFKNCLKEESNVEVKMELKLNWDSVKRSRYLLNLVLNINNCTTFGNFG